MEALSYLERKYKKYQNIKSQKPFLEFIKDDDLYEKIENK